MAASHSRLSAARISALHTAYRFIHIHAESRPLRITHYKQVACLRVSMLVRGNETVKCGQRRAMLIRRDYNTQVSVSHMLKGLGERTHKAGSTSVPDAAVVAKKVEAFRTQISASAPKASIHPPRRTASAASSSNTASVPSRRPTNLVPRHSRSSFSASSRAGRVLPRYASSLRNPGAPLSGLAKGLPRLTGTVECEDADAVAGVPTPGPGANGL